MGFDPQIQAFFKENRRKFGITFAEGMDALERMLAAGQPQVVVSTQDFRAMMALTRDFTVAKILEMAHPGDGERVRHPRPLLGSSFVTPSSELEKKIAAIWCDLLRLEQIGIQDNFFELGGNSLLGVDLIRRMKNEFEVEIPLHALYDASTVSAMSVLLGEPSATAASLDERRERGTERRERAQQLKQRAQARKRRARAEPAAGRLH